MGQSSTISIRAPRGFSDVTPLKRRIPNWGIWAYAYCMTVSRIASITVPVTSHDRAVGLYQGVLGFSVISDRTNTERGRELHMTAPGGGAAIILVSASKQHRAGSAHGGALQVRDMLEVVEGLANAGINVTITVQHLNTEAGVWAEFQDYDGNSWMLWQPAEHPFALIAA